MGRILMGFAFVAAAVLAGCAGTARIDAGDGPAVTGDVWTDAGLLVEVRNDLILPTSLTVWLVRDNGGRNLVGSIAPNATETFGVEPVVQSGEYRLVAETTDGTDLASREFVAGRGEFVSWRLSTNTVTVTRR